MATPPQLAMPREKWKPVVGYEKAYEVSDRGRVRSLDRFVLKQLSGGRLSKPHFMKGRVLRSGIASHGYPTVVLGQQHKTHCVHILVPTAFVGPAPDNFECRHLNGKRNDPRLSNLCWGSHSDNLRDKKRHLKLPISNQKLTPKDVLKIRRLLKWKTPVREIAEMFSVSGRLVRYIRSGEYHADVVS